MSVELEARVDATSEVVSRFGNAAGAAAVNAGDIDPFVTLLVGG